MARKGKGKHEEHLDGQGGPIEYRLVSGETVNVYPVSARLVQRIDERYVIPEPPTREVPTIDGDVEQIAKPEDPDYLAEVAELQEAKAEAILRLMTSQALRDIEVSMDDDWVDTLRWIEPEWEPPEDPRQLKVDYLQYWLIPSRQDWETISYLAIASTALGKEDVERTLKTFRAALQRETSQALSDTLLATFIQPETGDEPGGAVVGPDTG